MHALLQEPGILLQIIEALDIDALLSLRLTTRAIHDLFSRYESSIAQAVARVTFSTSRLLLRSLPDGKFTINWLIDLIPKQLVTIAVERWFPWFESNTDWEIPAEDPFSDPLRERVTHAWRILEQLSSISKKKKIGQNSRCRPALDTIPKEVFFE
jgi:hypothetical protein